MGNQHYERILTDNRQLGPYPMEKLKRVEQPTTRITDNIQRFDAREDGYRRAKRGDLGTYVQKEYLRYVRKYPLGAAQQDMLDYLAPVSYGEAAHSKAPLPEDPEILSRHIKRLGYFLRADIAGICQLPQYAVYSHDMQGNPVELDHKFAIVVLVDQDYETMHGSTGFDWISGSQSRRSYSTTAFLSCVMANYIRRLGYPARAHFSRCYQVVVPPLLLLAGIGEMCRIGNIVLNPFLGGRFKAAVVTTDLPLVPDKPVDFGLQEFCRKCMVCAHECPSGAIPTGDTVMYNGYEVWRPDIERCTKFRATNQKGANCARCIRVCPWNKPRGWTHDMVRWMVQHTPFLDSSLVKMDKIWGYGKQNKKDKWWLDLEDINGDGVLSIPKSSRL